MREYLFYGIPLAILCFAGYQAGSACCKPPIGNAPVTLQNVAKFVALWMLVQVGIVGFSLLQVLNPGSPLEPMRLLAISFMNVVSFVAGASAGLITTDARVRRGHTESTNGP